VSSEQPNISSKKLSAWKKITILTVIVLIVGVIVLPEIRHRSTKTGTITTQFAPPEETPAVPTPESPSVIPLPAPRPGQVAATADENNPNLLRSENFRLGDVSVGGDTIISTDGDRYAPLSIVFVRGEGISAGNEKEARVLISWKTSKSATSSITFGKNTGADTKTVQEDGFGMNHNVILSGLDLATTYLYTIKVRDQWNNEVTSDAYAVYTGARNISLFELIVGALGDTFGWAFQR